MYRGQKDEKKIKINKAFQGIYNLGKDEEMFIINSREEVVKQGRKLAEEESRPVANLKVAN